MWGGGLRRIVAAAVGSLRGEAGVRQGSLQRHRKRDGGLGAPPTTTLQELARFSSGAPEEIGGAFELGVEGKLLELLLEPVHVVLDQERGFCAAGAPCTRESWPSPAPLQPHQQLDVSPFGHTHFSGLDSVYGLSACRNSTLISGAVACGAGGQGCDSPMHAAARIALPTGPHAR